MLTEHCEFGDTLDMMLRDCLVCGVNNDQLQHRLLAEPHLTFAKAMQVSRTFETTTEEARILQHDARGTESLAANVLSNTNSADTTVRHTVNQMATKPCYQCGEAHPAGLNRLRVINVRRRATLLRHA